MRFRNGRPAHYRVSRSPQITGASHVAGSEGWAEKRGENTLATCKLRQQPEITEFTDFDIERAELDGFADYVLNDTPIRSAGRCGARHRTT